MSIEYEDLPEPIDAPAEVIARAIMSAPPKREWRYMKRAAEKKAARQAAQAKSKSAQSHAAD